MINMTLPEGFLIHLNPGEVVLFRLTNTIEPEQVAHLREWAKGTVLEDRFIVVGPDVEVTVVSAITKPTNPDEWRDLWRYPRRFTPKEVAQIADWLIAEGAYTETTRDEAIEAVSHINRVMAGDDDG